MKPRIWLLAAFMLTLASCEEPGARPGEPGSVTIHMGGSLTSFGAAASSSH